MDERPERHDLELYLLRHAHAGDPGAWQGDDAERPLSEKGRGQAERLGRYLAHLGLVPEAIVSSPKARALQTAEIVARHLHTTVSTHDRLAHPLDLAALAALLEAVPGGRVMIVGHDPDFSELTATLSGASYLPLKKGALARLDVSLPLQAGGGILRWLLPPDLLPE